MIASYWRPEGEKLRCLLCPHSCLLSEGRFGSCRVRFASGGRLSLPFYGAISAMAVDPIEKKPLYHFHPGSRILSLGFLSCNLACPFCQNWEISQSTDQETRQIPPEGLIAAAREAGSIGIAFTYSEPLVHFEYVRDLAAAFRDAGLKTVLVSNGYLRRDPAREILSLMDAANIDLKSFSAATYADRLKGGLEAVREFIDIAAGMVHLELTCLLVPGMNDSDGEIQAMTEWVAGINPDIPFHLSAYHPAWKSGIPATKASDLRRALGIARQKLHYVYSGNLPGSEENTLCRGCGALLVSRTGYQARLRDISGSKCARCGKEVPMILA